MSAPVITQGATGTDPLRAPRVPLAVALLAGLVTFGTWLMTLIGGQVTGVSWDEPYRVGKLTNLLQQGWFVDDLVDGQPADFNTYVYAPVYDLVSHAFAVVLTSGQWAEPSVTADAYAARHLSLAVLAAIGMVVVGLLVGLLLGGWRWALVATAILGSIALWTGHAMFNSSDLPVAVGYTIVTLAVILIVRQSARRAAAPPGALTSSPFAGWRWDLAWGLVLFIGTTLAIGTRPATWPAILVSLAVAIAGAAIVAGRSWRSGAVHAAVSAAGAMALTLVILALAYPKAFANPVAALIGSIGQSAKFGGQDGGDTGVTFASVLGYLPSWLNLQLPIGLIILARVGGIVAVVVIVMAVAAWRSKRTPDWRAVGLVAVGAQLLVLPLGAAIARSNVYDGVRQFLFIIPPVAIFATVGVAALVLLAARVPKGRPWWSVAAWVLVGVSVLLPITDQWRLFPYNYTYANETASPLNDRVPTDYWRTSMRELVPMVPADGATACNFDPLILGLVPIDCANAGQVAPYLDTRGTESIGVSVPPGKYLYLASNRGRSAPPPDSGCSVIDQVTRTLHGEEVVMAYVALCEAPCVVQEAASCAGKSLVAANLDGWNLRGSDFSGADFTGASLVLANLTGANLTGANLTGVNLEQADLTDARLDGVIATGLIGTPKALPAGYRIEGGNLVRGG